MADDVSRLWLHVLADSERTGNALLSDLFEQDKARVVNMTKTLSDGDSEIVVDFSKQLVDQPALKICCSWQKRRESSKNLSRCVMVQK